MNFEFWFKSGNKPVLKKIAQLLESVSKTPYEGIGKPEPLKHQLSGFWSRRIDAQHRLVYSFEADTLLIAQCRDHY